MKAKVEQFWFTPKGGTQRIQQVHEASFDLVTDNEGQTRLAMWIKTTRPGETLDDRGVEGWDAAACIDVTTDPLDITAIDANGLTMPNAVATEKYSERFLYYWEHSDFVTIHLTIELSDEGWRVTFDGNSESEDAVKFIATVER